MTKKKEDKKETTSLLTLPEAKELGNIFVESGFFQDTKEQSQAIVKIIAGREIGIAPMEAMTGIHVIKGKITVGANVMAAAVKNSGKYNYKVIEHTAQKCIIHFFEGKEKIGESEFTIQNAKDAEVHGPTWRKYPKNMLFARAMSNGVKWYCPDVFGHSPVYIPEEMGAEVNGDGEPINVTPTPVVGVDYAKPGTESFTPEPFPSGDIQDADFEEPKEEAEDHCGFCEFTGSKDEVDEHIKDKHPEPEPEEPEHFTLDSDYVEEDEEPRKAFVRILDKAFHMEADGEVRQMVKEFFPEYERGKHYPMHIPEKAIIQVIEKVCGVKLKSTERMSTCKTKDCKNKITKPQKEEEEGMCLEHFQESLN